MKTIKFETAIEKYNEAMFAADLEHYTIGTRFTDDNEGGNPNDYNLDNMIEETKKWINEYGTYGCRDINEAYDKEERSYLRAEKKALVKFVKWAEAHKDNIEPKPETEKAQENETADLETTLRNALEPFKAEWNNKIEAWANVYFDKVSETRAANVKRNKKVFEILHAATRSQRNAHSYIYIGLREEYNRLNKLIEHSKWVREYTKSEWIAKQAENTESGWETNIETLVAKCEKFDIDETRLNIEFNGVTPKGFDLVLTDGKNRTINARMIWAAESSYLVKPHVRYIVTEKKIK